MEPKPDDAKRLQAQTLLNQIQRKESLIREVRKSWISIGEFVYWAVGLILILTLYWVTRREWRPPDTALLLWIGCAVGYVDLRVGKRLDALIELLELEGLLKLKQSQQE